MKSKDGFVQAYNAPVCSMTNFLEKVGVRSAFFRQLGARNAQILCPVCNTPGTFDSVPYWDTSAEAGLK